MPDWLSDVAIGLTVAGYLAWCLLAGRARHLQAHHRHRRAMRALSRATTARCAPAGARAASTRLSRRA